MSFGLGQHSSSNPGLYPGIVVSSSFFQHKCKLPKVLDMSPGVLQLVRMCHRVTSPWQRGHNGTFISHCFRFFGLDRTSQMALMIKLSFSYLVHWPCFACETVFAHQSASLFCRRSYHKPSLLSRCCCVPRVTFLRFLPTGDFARHSFMYICRRFILSLSSVDPFHHCFLNFLLSLSRHSISCCLLDIGEIGVFINIGYFAPNISTHQCKSVCLSTPASSLLFLVTFQDTA